MISNDLNLLINKYKQTNDLDEQLKIEQALIDELKNNPKGIIIHRTIKYKFNIADTDYLDWLIELIIDNDENLSIEELLCKDYISGNQYFYEDDGEVLEDNSSIYDLDGNLIDTY